MLQRLVYSSKSVGHVWLQTAQDIVLASLRDNPRRDITGCLCCSAAEYLQVIEGPASEVEELFEIIQADRRHHDIRVSERAEIEYRRFDSWAMAFAPRIPEHEPVFLKHLPTMTSNFRGLGPEAQLALLFELNDLADKFTDALVLAYGLSPRA